MAMGIWREQTGNVSLRSFDEGLFATLGAAVVQTPGGDPTYQISCGGTSSKTNTVSGYFTKPEQAFKKRIFPVFTVHRDDFPPAPQRWMGGGQLEYKAGVTGTERVVNGVSGYGSYVSKAQAFPFDINYTITVWDRYEWGASALLLKMLKVCQPVSRILITDSLGLSRSYDMLLEGSPQGLEEVLDAVTRLRGYAIGVRILGELDLNDPVVRSAATGVSLNLHRI